MVDVANIFALVQEGVQGSRGTLAGIWGYLNQLGLGGSELGTGGTAIVLGAVWYFARIIRTVVSILFVICILLLILQLTGYVDLSALLSLVKPEGS